MIDYMKVIETYHEGMGVTMADCCNYSTIDWNGLTPIPQATMDAEWLGVYKTDAIVSMSVLAQADITESFLSSALGGSPPYKYDSKYEDQLNLIGAKPIDAY